VQQRELPRGSGRSLPERQTRPGQQEQRVVDQLQDPRPQQPGGHQQKHRGTKPGRSTADDEQHESGKGAQRGERRVEGTSDTERQRGAEGDRSARGSPCGADESGRDQWEQDVRDDRAESSACLRCGQGPQRRPRQRRPRPRPRRSSRDSSGEVCRPRGQRDRSCQKPGDRGADRRRGSGEKRQVLDDPGSRRQDRQIRRRLERIAQSCSMPSVEPRMPQPGGVGGHRHELAAGETMTVGKDQRAQQRAPGRHRQQGADHDRQKTGMAQDLRGDAERRHLERLGVIGDRPRLQTLRAPGTLIGGRVGPQRHCVLDRVEGVTETGPGRGEQPS